MFGASPSKPKMVLVMEFVASPVVEAIDRGFSARMDRKGINYPILEPKRRTLGRVNDEIVAAIVATLREARLDARPGSEEGLTLTDQAAVVNGWLRAGEEGGLAKNKQIGFGAGHGGVTAEMKLSYSSGGGKKQLLTFDADAKDAGKPRRRTTRRSPRLSRKKRRRRNGCRPMWRRSRAGSATPRA